MLRKKRQLAISIEQIVEVWGVQRQVLRLYAIT
jgi:hypothetical protein